MALFKRSNEILPLVIALLIAIGAGYFIYDINAYIILLGLGVALTYVAISNASLIGNALLINTSTLPKINKLLMESSKKLGTKIPKLYIQQNPELNAFTIGLSNPSIVITSSLFDALTDEEFEFILGHEMGHIFFKHNWLTTLIYPAGRQIPIINFFFDFWSRQAEYNADAVGLYCSGDIDAAISALTKITVGTKLSRIIDKNAIAQQNREVNSLFERIGETLSNHPYATRRVSRLLSFHDKNKSLIVNDF